MQKLNSEILYSATDIANFLECEHLTTLDQINLTTPLPKTADDEQAKLIQAKGYEHEAHFVEHLKTIHNSFIDIAKSSKELEDRISQTLLAMRGGVEIIYQATLRDGAFIGHADFLRRVPRPSALGNFSYEVLDTKLSRTTKGKFIIQLVFYSALLSKAQGTPPLMMHVILGDQREDSHRVADYTHYFQNVIQRFIARIEHPQETYPDPCEKCDLCRYHDLCENRRQSDDHLCQVAGISKTQMRKLQSAGITTLEKLATAPDRLSVPDMATDTLTKLSKQAALQHTARVTGHRQLELIPPDGTSVTRGFSRLPKPDAGDLFFDMEGDPLEDGGLEYLFGVYFHQNGKAEFKAFWAHNRAEEKNAFEEFMDFVTQRLIDHPSAHIYHYANYEQAAIKRLMSLHGTREAEVDNLLRTGKMIDLYRVVREGIRVSEPSYSIKNIEHFYLEARSGDVTNAGASIVYYERWKETGDTQLLNDIESYNFDDVRSTYELREWLVSLRPAHLPWWSGPATDPDSKISVGTMTDAEKRLIPYRQQLIDPLPSDSSQWSTEARLGELTYQLLDFHRRAAKPAWWALFERREKTSDELLEDVECLAGLVADHDRPPRADKRSTIYSFVFPEQETKLKTQDPATLTHSGDTISDLVIDEDARRVSFKIGNKRDPIPEVVSIGPGKPISTEPMQEALFRFADSLISNSRRYPAIEGVLKNEIPRIRDASPGTPVVPVDNTSVDQVAEAVRRLNHSHLFLQGPPGAGKTYTGSHVIVALMQAGFRVGITANSHKAINNLLSAIENAALDANLSFSGLKKSDAKKPDTHINGTQIVDTFDNQEIASGLDNGALLIAGTSWLFSRPELDQSLDYLFIDEAGQVALANLVAMGTCARNIVLLGDQMQLGQPIQGVHPGRSGLSCLEFLLDGLATIPPERGIFLSTTWRMHPAVCEFISEAVYDGRLKPESQNVIRELILKSDYHPYLASSGIRYLPIEHKECSQRSDEEASLVRELVDSLLRQQYRDKHGVEHALTLENILVVSPYNMQVNLLSQMLPQGTRVGTVDKFQGQEAEVVIVSMATSSGEDLPRNIEFLYSKNRLNVAISRAKCLCLFIANPNLMSIRCTTPEQMSLVNTLCWVSAYGSSPQ